MEITVPKLNEMASLPFTTFIANKNSNGDDHLFVGQPITRLFCAAMFSTGCARCGVSTIASSSRTSLPALIPRRAVRACKS